MGIQKVVGQFAFVGSANPQRQLKIWDKPLRAFAHVNGRHIDA